MLAHCYARQKKTKRKTYTNNQMALKSNSRLLETHDCSIKNVSFSVIIIITNARE